MKTQEAIGILMLSPGYWRMKMPERKELIHEFMASYSAIDCSLVPVPEEEKAAVIEED